MLGLFNYGMLLVPATLLASGAMFAGFAALERRLARPMPDLGFLRDPGVLGLQALAVSPAFLFIVLSVLLPGRFIGMDGYGALHAGQMMVWLAAPLLTRWFTPAALSGAFAADRCGHRPAPWSICCAVAISRRIAAKSMTH